MKTLLVALACVMFLPGCGRNVRPQPECASTPVVVRTTQTRYVPIDPALRTEVDDPTPGPLLRVGDAVKAAHARLAALREANARLAAIGLVQGQPPAKQPNP